MDITKDKIANEAHKELKKIGESFTKYKVEGFIGQTHSFENEEIWAIVNVSMNINNTIKKFEKEWKIDWETAKKIGEDKVEQNKWKRKFEDFIKEKEEEIAPEKLNGECERLQIIKAQLTALNAKVRAIQKEKQKQELILQNLISGLPEKKHIYKDREYSVKESIRVTRTVDFDKLWSNHPEIYTEYVGETRKYTEKLYDKKAKKAGGK